MLHGEKKHTTHRRMGEMFLHDVRKKDPSRRSTERLIFFLSANKMLVGSTQEDVVKLVRRLAKAHTPIDNLAELLEDLWAVFPPNEHIMRNLSLMHQRLEGQGGEEEFCTALVHSTAMMFLSKKPPSRQYLRTKSFPPCNYRKKHAHAYKPCGSRSTTGSSLPQKFLSGWKRTCSTWINSVRF